ncbi:hypothetical protein HZH66_012600 [Vespula vulgaris]|uniref:Uncharacterized protein n=1 Tax=Vespula vulgaris TaxID=7454 RepID=A0A834MTX1_VESVU|nr:hypothetical protein HZH66_012600 [Vespula vulgaris]
MLTDEASEVGGGKDGDRDGGKGRSEGGNGVSVRQLARARENPNVGRLRESDREPRSTAFHNLPNGTY